MGRSKLRGIPSPKNERFRRKWIAMTSLVTDCSALASLKGLRLRERVFGLQTTGEELKRANQILKALLEEYKGAADSPSALNGKRNSELAN
jgi:hypothetical protein